MRCFDYGLMTIAQHDKMLMFFYKENYPSNQIYTLNIITITAATAADKIPFTNLKKENFNSEEFGISLKNS